MTFSDRVIQTMKRRQLTCAELSRKSGIPPGTLWKIRAGQDWVPQIETARKLANALNVPVGWLYGDVKDGSN